MIKTTWQLYFSGTTNTANFVAAIVIVVFLLFIFYGVVSCTVNKTFSSLDPKYFCFHSGPIFVPWVKRHKFSTTLIERFEAHTSYHTRRNRGPHEANHVSYIDTEGNRHLVSFKGISSSYVGYISDILNKHLRLIKGQNPSTAAKMADSFRMTGATSVVDLRKSPIGWMITIGIILLPVAFTVFAVGGFIQNMEYARLFTICTLRIQDR